VLNARNGRADATKYAAASATDHRYGFKNCDNKNKAVFTGLDSKMKHAGIRREVSRGNYRAITLHSDDHSRCLDTYGDGGVRKRGLVCWLLLLLIRMIFVL
jgi:hypothetical protein